MVDKGKYNLLGILINAIDYDAAVNRVLTAAHHCQPLTLSALAVHGVMTGVLDAEQRYRLNHLDIGVPDGQPVRWALNLLYHLGLNERVYGPTLMLRICEQASLEGLPIFFLYGSRPQVLQQLCHNLQRRFPRLIIAGVQPSQFRRLTAEEQQAIAAHIRTSRAAITFVGLGCPRQEVWAYEHRDLLSMPIIQPSISMPASCRKPPNAPAAWSRMVVSSMTRTTSIMAEVFLAQSTLCEFIIGSTSPTTAL